MINKATLLGRLTKDPVINYTQGEKATCVARYTLAVTRKFKKDEADFISCVSFGNLAEIIQKYVSKGDQICVAGRIQTGSYTNREGQKVYTTDVIVNAHHFCESKGEASAPSAPTTDDFMNVPGNIDEECPFG
jgi:single-strand DNA-binding protein